MSFKVDAPKIKRWREERQWSQEHLADLAGIGLRTIQRIENGEAGSRETLMALAAAFNVDTMALCIDPETEVSDRLRAKNRRARAGILLSFWIHLASYVLGMVVFIGIGLGIGNVGEMAWPAIWWTVGIVAHAATVVIIHVVTHYSEQF
ncbi:XRE family transcriptional regulator [uncultured Maricaulis sp.]|uniref:XRE family transcriptional regulator n=1 Tax=uncultured Maricaulis sp. TaxID=174710 RepID=UPI00262780C1|nr:XRE family transcriptional regulator [uncultured Maricaulis sp.]